MNTTLDLRRVIEEIDLEEWLDDQGIGYKRVGSDNIQLDACPWCGGKRVYASRSKKRGLCFHGDCQEKFNFWSLAQQVLRTDNRGVAQQLEAYALRQGFRPARSDPRPSTPQVEACRIPDSIALPTEDGQTHPFLVDRHILPATQALFGLRYCHRGFHAYEDMESGRQRRQKFSERIIIPVADTDGTVKTFQGRDVTGEAEKRYLFPMSLPGTGRFIYGAHLVKGRSHLVMGEGPFDVMAIHQALDHPDFRMLGAVGSFGLAIGASDAEGNDQLGRFRQLHRDGLQTVTIMWDGEVGALRAALVAGKLLRAQGIAVRIALLPQDRDPNEVDTATVRRAIEQAETLTDPVFFRLRCAPPYR